jgi:hypothetical protein
MTYDEVLKAIEKSDPDDWARVNEHHFTYKYDLMIRLEEKQRPDGIGGDFYEPWMDNFPDKTGLRVIYTVFYGNSRLIEVPLVSVDGHRSLVPFPTIGSQPPTISHWRYKFAKVVEYDGYRSDPIHNLDAALKRAKITVE